MKDLKSKILIECKRIIDEKMDQLNVALNDVTESSNSESKSSAGDKHETSKALMHIEQEKLSKQLSELKTQKQELEKIKINISTTKISSGSYIETNNGSFFIAVSIGKIKIDDKEIFVVSQQSPIGEKLMMVKGNNFELNNKAYSVLSIT